MRLLGRSVAVLCVTGAAALAGIGINSAAAASEPADCPPAQPWAVAPIADAGCAPADGSEPGWPASRPSTPDLSGSSANAIPPTAADANGGNSEITTELAMETARGTALTGAWPGPGGGYLRVHSLGTVARMDARGHTIWERDSSSLYKDWQLTFEQSGYTSTPQIVFGTDAADPFELSTAEPFVVHDTQPYAIGDLTGNGAPDVAVAETVGVNLGGGSCFECAWPFSVPGSALHLGTFVTVLDGQTGKTVYSELDPGFVTQLAVVGHTLVVGDETGSPQTASGVGQWWSTTDVRGLTFQRGGSGLSAHVAWTYNTGAPWGRLLALTPAGAGRVALSWSDTPLDLGVPGPPDGHVVLLDAATGSQRWDVRTTGYPVLAAYDADRNLLAVIEEQDPSLGVSYSVDALTLGDGRRVFAATREGSLPTTLAIANERGGTAWAVGSVDTTQALVRPPSYSFTAGRVSIIDPSRGTELQSTTLTTGLSGQPAEPGALAAVSSGRDAVIAVASWVGVGVDPTPQDPVAQNTNLQGLDATTGHQLWDETGDTADPLSLTTLAGSFHEPASLLSITQELQAQLTDPATGRSTSSQPLMGDLDTGAITDVNGDGRPDLIAGDESGAVYAFDGRDLSDGRDVTSRPRVLWQADLPRPVHQIVVAHVGGASFAVVAMTGGVAVLDLRTGSVVHEISLPGSYVWTVAVSGATVIVPTDDLSAYDLLTGRHLWTYAPPAASYFSDAAVLNGTVVSEYASQGKATPKTMAAVGVDAATGKLKWQAAAAAPEYARAQLYNGVVAGPSVPGAGGDGAAFSWSAPNGQGRVDVRGVSSGALLYSVSGNDLSNHVGFVPNPSGGLLAFGQIGTETIDPSSPVSRSGPTGLGVGFATTSDGSQVFAVTNGDLAVYPASLPTGTATPAPAPLASDETFLANHLLIGSFGGGPGDDVVTMPVDWQAWQVVNGEAGIGIGPYAESVEHGLAVDTLTGSAASSAAAAKPVRAPTQPTPTSLPAAPPALGLGTTQPQFEARVLGRTPDGQPLLTQTTPAGYSPDTISKYLGLTGDGNGQTIAIVDAYDDPNISSDVDAFSSQFALPLACGSPGAGSDCFKFNLLQPSGTPATNAGWSLETSLDVEWAHAIAPQATIDLVQAHDATFASMFAAVDAAAALHPDAISNSWGIDEEFSDEGFYDRRCQLADSLCVVSSGDKGYPGSYPAYNPAVLAIGGTTLKLAADGTVSSELAWSGSGGGRSYFESKPGYQSGIAPDPGRGIPDVSFDADPNTGVAVYDTVTYLGQAGWWQVGGTSVGAPSWSAILADGDQLRGAAGKESLTSSGDGAQQAVYGLRSGVADITQGPTNGFCPDICQARPGYDYQTGLGSPRSAIDNLLASAP